MQRGWIDIDKIDWNFVIQTDKLILARISDLVLINEKKITCNSKTSPTTRSKAKEMENLDKSVELARESGKPYGK